MMFFEGQVQCAKMNATSPRWVITASQPKVDIPPKRFEIWWMSRGAIQLRSNRKMICLEFLGTQRKTEENTRPHKKQMIENSKSNSCFGWFWLCNNAGYRIHLLLLGFGCRQLLHAVHKKLRALKARIHHAQKRSARLRYNWKSMEDPMDSSNVRLNQLFI